MAEPINIALVARQAGSAHALSPVAEAIVADGGRALLIAFEQAADVWAAERRDVIANDEPAAVEALEPFSPDGVLTGTSFDAAGDGRWWALARQRRIPAMAFVDSWINYAVRFTVGEPFDTLPDRIAVTDALAREGMIDAGGDASMIDITGNPAFDYLADLPSGQASDRQALFVGEPLAKETGFGAIDALAVLVDALPSGATVHVKAHPRQPMPEALSLRARRDDIAIELTDAPKHELLARCGIVAGVTSILLYEAMLAGRTVVSIQPGQHIDSPVVDRPGIRHASTVDDVAASLRPVKPAPAPPHPPAAATIITHLRRML